MFKLCPWLLCTTAFLLVGSRSSPWHRIPARELESAAVRNIKDRANEAYRLGEFKAAASEYRQGYSLALAEGRRSVALSCLSNAAGAQLAGYDYPGALQSFVNARKLAQQVDNASVQAVIWLNLSSLYLILLNYSAAEQAALRASEIADKLPKFAYRAEILAQLGSFRIRNGDYGSGLELFRNAINSASDAGNEGLRAILNERAGWLLLERGSYVEAEPYVSEAFRLRIVSHYRDLRSSYIAASRLKLGQGDVPLAAALIDRAASLPAYDAGQAWWLGHYQRGLVRMAQGRIPEGRVAFRLALDAAVAWHEGAASCDQARIASDIGTHQLAVAFVDASVQLGETSQAFLAAEQDRAAGLRQAIQRFHRAGDTAEFSNALAHLREAQTALLIRPDAERRHKVEQLRSELSELEATTYLKFEVHTARITERTSPANTLRNIQDRIRPGEALLSFYPGARGTYLWALTNKRFEFHRLASIGLLEELAGRVALAVQSEAPDRDHLSGELYRQLFGQLSATIGKQPRWILTAGDALFRVPYAVLVASAATQHPVYLVETHSVVQIPSAWMLSREGSTLRKGGFLGVGDGIYNSADPRWNGRGRQKVQLQLARLPGSGPEVEGCARQWSVGGPAILLTGQQATRQAVQTAVRRKPAVLHFAAHFLYPGNLREETVIHLGLDRWGRAEMLSREDVSNLNVAGALVVMSGCSSVAAGAVAGAGVLGLSRAWLMAGASTVVGSLWPTPDDSGKLFQSFYAHLRPVVDGPIERSAADALQAAQIEMVHSPTWRADPRYWGAFYVMGKD